MQSPLNESGWAFPLVECVHLAGIACGVGTAALVNLRLLGVGLTRNSASQLWDDVMPWTLGGLVLALFSGLLLFSIDPQMYFANSVFRLKMLFLVLAIIFYYTAVRRIAASDGGGPARSLVACISLGLWALAPFGGILLGFA